MPSVTTIDKLDIGVYIQYARRTQLVEQINRQFHLKDASSIPVQTQIVNIYPALKEIDILMGVIAIATPWAYFFPPKKYRRSRRSPFARHRVVPSIGSFEEQKRLALPVCVNKHLTIELLTHIILLKRNFFVQEGQLVWQVNSVDLIVIVELLLIVLGFRVGNRIERKDLNCEEEGGQYTQYLERFRPGPFSWCGLSCCAHEIFSSLFWFE